MEAINAILKSDIVMSIWAISILGFIVLLVLYLNTYDKDFEKFKRSGRMMVEDISSETRQLLSSLSQQTLLFHEHEDLNGIVADYLEHVPINELLNRPCSLCHFPRYLPPRPIEKDE